MLNLTTPLFNPIAIALMIDLHGLFAAVIAIALIGVSVFVALILLITGVVHQKKHGLSFTQQKRFGYFLGAWVSSLFCFFIILIVDNPELCQEMGHLFLQASNVHTGCYQVRKGLDQLSTLWAFAIVVSGILVGALWPNIRRFLAHEKSE